MARMVACDRYGPAITMKNRARQVSPVFSQGEQDRQLEQAGALERLREQREHHDDDRRDELIGHHRLGQVAASDDDPGRDEADQHRDRAVPPRADLDLASLPTTPPPVGKPDQAYRARSGADGTDRQVNSQKGAALAESASARGTVLIAGAANIPVGAIKLAAGIMIGSSAMLAEAAHSARR
jgi:hypothetical protein